MNFKHLEHTKDQFIKVANSQERKGIEKYGKPLDPMDNYDWLDMEFEELIDAVKYNRAEKSKRNVAIEQIRKLVAWNCKPSVMMEVEHWLEKLEGKK